MITIAVIGANNLIGKYIGNKLNTMMLGYNVHSITLGEAYNPHDPRYSQLYERKRAFFDGCAATADRVCKEMESLDPKTDYSYIIFTPGHSLPHGYGVRGTNCTLDDAVLSDPDKCLEAAERACNAIYQSIKSGSVVAQEPSFSCYAGEMSNYMANALFGALLRGRNFEKLGNTLDYLTKYVFTDSPDKEKTYAGLSWRNVETIRKTYFDILTAVIEQLSPEDTRDPSQITADLIKSKPQMLLWNHAQFNNKIIKTIETFLAPSEEPAKQ